MMPTQIRLEQLGPEVIDPYLEMLADPEGRRLTATTARFERPQIFEWLSTRASVPNRRDWAIKNDETGEFLGEVVLNDFNDSKNSINLRIALRGTQVYGQGIGTQAVSMALEYAFDELMVEKVTLEVLVDNIRAQRAYEKNGFVPKTQFSEKSLRYQRMVCTKPDYVEARALALMKQHLDVSRWSFGWDNAKRRAGLCNYTESKISISKYLVMAHSVDESLQVVLHEIAHALSGKKEGHGKKWLATAKSIGYRAERFTGTEIAREVAPWRGQCPVGHEHFRYRKPTRPLSCGVCSRSFSAASLITWMRA
jgi:RimJ/RimL family protein N-acetyltransferase/predicted SprT family Zn-dependent metalloprotease